MDKITELVNKYELDKVDAGCLYNSQELKENLIKNLKEAINYSQCCKSDSEQLKCGDCDCKAKYPNIGCDDLKDCKKDW